MTLNYPDKTFEKLPPCQFYMLMDLQILPDRKEVFSNGF